MFGDSGNKEFKYSKGLIVGIQEVIGLWVQEELRNTCNKKDSGQAFIKWGSEININEG